MFGALGGPRRPARTEVDLIPRRARMVPKPVTDAQFRPTSTSGFFVVFGKE
jgi:hypothetical protein